MVLGLSKPHSTTCAISARKMRSLTIHLPHNYCIGEVEVKFQLRIRGFRIKKDAQGSSQRINGPWSIVKTTSHSCQVFEGMIPSIVFLFGPGSRALTSLFLSHKYSDVICMKRRPWKTPQTRMRFSFQEVCSTIGGLLDFAPFLYPSFWPWACISSLIEYASKWSNINRQAGVLLSALSGSRYYLSVNLVFRWSFLFFYCYWKRNHKDIEG